MIDILKDIQKNKKDYLRAETGADFEDRFENSLRENGYSKIIKRDITESDFRLVKEFIVRKQDSDFLGFKRYAKTFIKIPFGSQNYPDFIVFSGKYAIPIEIKYSKKIQTRPMWNSGIPRANGLYIFGSYGNKDITFFFGKDVLNKKRRTALIDFFKEIKKRENDFKKIAKNSIPDDEKRGFMPYVRRAYGQEKISKYTELNYFTHPNRVKIEKDAIKFLSHLIK